MDFKKRLHDLEDRCMPAGFLASADPDTERRARLTARFALMMAVVAWVYVLPIALMGMPGMSAFLAALGVMYAIPLALLRLRGNLAAARTVLMSAFMLGLMVFVVLSGGLASTSWPWFPVLVVLGVLLGGKRTGWIWTGITSAATIAVLAAQRGGVPWPESVIPPEAADANFAMGITGGIIVSCLLAGLYESAKEQMLQQIEAARQEAEREGQRAEQARWEAQLVLDSVDQGLLMTDRAGRLLPGRSSAVERWLGVPEPGAMFSDYIAARLPELADWIELAWEMFEEDVMPADVVFSQIPARHAVGEDIIEFRYSLVPAAGEDRVLIVISDVTAIVEAEQAEASQRELMSFITRLTSDKVGSMEFLHESEAILEALRSDVGLPVKKRLLHTLKGNTATFGLVSVAARCHSVESAVEERGMLTGQLLASLDEVWGAFSARIAPLIDHNQAVTVSEGDYEAFIGMIAREVSHEALLTEAISWTQEKTADRLQRISEQAHALSTRLGREVEIQIVDGDLTMEPRGWAPFWSAFVHVIRNALDHGIEPPEEREETGKPRKGQLTLRTVTEGGRLLVELEDDGRGICWEKIEAAAHARGVSIETDADRVRALCADGVSTAAELSEISGRGLGVGAVVLEAERLGGVLEIDSVFGQGTTFRFVFPAAALDSARAAA